MFRSKTSIAALIAVSLSLTSDLACAQEKSDVVKPVPVLSGSFGFVPVFDGGHAPLVTIMSPVLLVPIANNWLVESRGAFEGAFTRPDGGGNFAGKINKEVEYLQLDYLANGYLTVTAGRFLNPFGIYNERLYPVWIRNVQTEPLILPLEEDSRDGFMLRGGIPLSVANFNYATFFSTRASINKLESDRAVGSRFGFFFPKQRLEMGASVQHSLEQDRSNKFGFPFEQQPFSLPLDLRAEYAHGVEGSGFWIEPAYRLAQIPFLNGILRKTQVVARYQQFYIGDGTNDDLPAADTRIFESGFNYYIADGLKLRRAMGGNSAKKETGISGLLVWPIAGCCRWAEQACNEAPAHVRTRHFRPGNDHVSGYAQSQTCGSRKGKKYSL